VEEKQDDTYLDTMQINYVDNSYK